MGVVGSWTENIPCFTLIVPMPRIFAGFMSWSSRSPTMKAVLGLELASPRVCRNMFRFGLR